MNKKYLCVVLYHGDSGQKFGEELLRHFQAAYGKNVPVVIDHHSYAEDKYDTIIRELTSSKYCILAINKEFLDDSWQQYCTRLAQSYSMENQLTLVPVGIDNFKSFTGFWNIYSPVVFGSDFANEHHKFEVIVRGLEYEGVCSASSYQAQSHHTQAVEENSENEMWLALIASCESLIIEGTDPVNYIDRLISTCAVTIEQAESIHAAGSRRAQVETIINSVKENGTNAIQLLISSLKEFEKHTFSSIHKEFMLPNGLHLPAGHISSSSWPQDDKDENSKWLDVWKSTFKVIIDNVDPCHIIDELYATGAITVEQEAEIQGYPDKGRKMVHTLNAVRLRGPGAIKKLIQSLSANDFHVYEEIVENHMKPKGLSFDDRGVQSRPHGELSAVSKSSSSSSSSSLFPQSPAHMTSRHELMMPIQESEPPSYNQYQDDQHLDLSSPCKKSKVT